MQTNLNLPMSRVALVLLLVSATNSVSLTRAATQPPARAGRLNGGARSLDGLIVQLLAALKARDAAALDRLRVTQREYLDVIMPGNVEPGQPRQRMPREKAEFWWSMLDEKSRFHQLRLLADYGGHDLQARKVAFDKGEKSFAGFHAYRQLRLVVEGEDGTPRELETGSIAEVRGTFKFVSFVRD